MPAGRNDPCPCGSGKKYKKCCLNKDRSEQHDAWQQQWEAAEEQRLAEQTPRDAPAIPSFARNPLWEGDVAKGSYWAGKKEEPWADYDEEDSIDDEEGDSWEEDDEDAWDEDEDEGDEDEDEAWDDDEDEDEAWDDDDGPEASSDEEDDSPRRQAIDTWCTAFEKADLEGRINAFLKALDQPSWLIEAAAFDALHSIREDLAQRNEWDRLGLLVGALRERQPEVFADEAGYLLPWLIEEAIRQGRWEDVAALATEMAALADRHIDTFSLVLDQLGYHGQSAALLAVMRVAWPKVRDSDEILPWGIAEFRNRAIWLETLDYCRTAAAPRTDDPELRERIARFSDECDEVWLRWVIGAIAPADCDRANEAAGEPGILPASEQSDGAEAADPLFVFVLEFLGYAIREEKVPFSKACMAHGELVDYLAQRAKPGSGGRKRRRGRKKQADAPRLPDRTVLCPTHTSLDRFLFDLLGPFHSGAYRVAAVMELIPAWLRFLHARGVIDSHHHAAAFADLAPLNESLLRYWQNNHREDPALCRGAAEAWRRAPAGLRMAGSRPE